MKSNFSFKTVMVIDDSEMDRIALEKMLPRNCFAEAVISYESAIDALEYLKETKVSLPEIIFLDINMPEMDGLKFLEEYDKLPERVKNNCIIIVLSNTSNTFEIKRAEENKHVTLFLPKPLTKGKQEVLASAFSDILKKNNDRLAV